MSISFIHDKNVDLSNSDLLGTKAYADTLFEIIKGAKNDNKSISIGLFGDWGSGKSSIITTLKNQLEREEQNIKFIEYDAWIHSEDSFKRSFIEKLIQALELDPSYSLNRLYESISIEKEIEDKINWHKFFRLLISKLIPATLVLLFIIYATDTKAIIAGIVFFSAVVGDYLKTLIGRKEITISQGIVFSQNQFISIFDEIVQCAFGKFKRNGLTKPDLKWIDNWPKKIKYDKLIISIDNIDRCNKEHSMRLLSATKNFMEFCDCIFIIPLADSAIFSQLAETYSEKESKEYLRKFFNSTIRLNEYSQNDIYDYTYNLIKKNFNFEKTIQSRLAHLISQGFTNNPRRVIHFLNNLKTEISIYKNLEDEPGQLSTNILYVAKILIIKNEWNEIYKLISYDHRLLKTLEEGSGYKVDLTNFNYPELSNNANSFCIKDSKGKIYLIIPSEAHDFFRLTKLITSPIREHYFRLKPNNDLITQNLTKDFEQFNQLVEENEFTKEEVVAAIERELHNFVIRRKSLEIGGIDIIKNSIKLYCHDNMYNSISKIIDPYVKLIQPSLLMNCNFEEVIHSYAKSSEQNSNNLPHQIIDKFLKEKSITLEGKEPMLNLISEDPINYELSEEAKHIFTSHLASINCETLSNDVWKFRQNISTSIVDVQIQKIVAESEEILELNFLDFLTSNNLLPIEKEEYYKKNLLEKLNSATEDELLVYTKNIVTLLNSKVDKSEIFKHLGVHVFEKESSNELKTKYLQELLRLLNSKEYPTIPYNIMDYVTQDINANSVTSLISTKLGKRIFEEYGFTSTLLLLGKELYKNVEAKMKGKVQKKIQDKISSIPSDEITKHFAEIFDSEIFPSTHRAKVAKKIYEIEGMKEVLKTFFKNLYPLNIKTHSSLFTSEELEDIAYNKMKRITTESSEISKLTEELDSMLTKEQVDNVLARLRKSNNFQHNYRSTMCSTLAEIINEREERQ